MAVKDRSKMRESRKLPRRRRDDSTFASKVEFVMQMLAHARDFVEEFEAAEQGLNPLETHRIYTDGLLKLHAYLDNKQLGLGKTVTVNINDRLESFGYVMSISLINTILETKKIDSDLVAKLPEQIESIKGTNGADSRWLRYRFVTRMLPKIFENPSRLERAIRLYARHTASSTSGDPSAERYRTACQTAFGGNYEEMKKRALRTVHKDIERVVRELDNINNAESLPEEPLSDQ